MEPIELTLADGSSIWLDRAAIISYSVAEPGTRILYLDENGVEKQADVLDGFAVVSDMMDPIEVRDRPGDFME